MDLMSQPQHLQWYKSGPQFQLASAVQRESSAKTICKAILALTSVTPA